MNKYASKIGLGTAQWGLDYGISNCDGLTPPCEVTKILKYAKSCGITAIDTAREYGSAERVLGNNDISSFCLCTKIPSLKNLETSIKVERHFKSAFEHSLLSLNVDKIEYLILHDCNDLFGPHGAFLIALLHHYKDSGLVNKIGISAYTSHQISSALGLFTPDIVQIPFSIFDQRLLADGTLNLLKSLDIEIHARSIFLQGLLLMNPKKLNNYFLPYMPFICNWHETCKNLGLQPLDLAIYFAVTNSLIDKVIIGVSTLCQLKEIIASAGMNWPAISSLSFTEFGHNSDELINPALWSLDS